MDGPKGILDNEEMIDSVVDMLSRGWRKGKIKKAVRQLAHAQGLIETPDEEGLGARSIESLLARARTRMKVMVQQADVDAKAEILNIFQGVLNRQAGKDDRIVVTAANGMMRLLGLEPQFGDKDGGDDDVDALRASLGIEPEGPPAPEEDPPGTPDTPETLELPDGEGSD